MNSSESLPSIQKNLLQQVNWSLFQSLPKPTQNVAFQIAVLNSFDIDILKALNENEAEIIAAIAQLDEFDLLQVDAHQRYSLVDDLRQMLLDVSRTPERITEFIRLNRIAFEYYRAREPLLIRELLYHQMIVDEEAGVETLTKYFEIAVDCFQLGDAQSLLRQAQALWQHLSEKTRAWLEYFQARLDFLLQARGEGELSFKVLKSEAPDAQIRALAGWHLGQLALRRDEWTNASQELRQSLGVLLHLGDSRNAMRVMLSLGDIYIDLAENNGGIQPEAERKRKPIQNFFYILLNLPFLLIAYLFHHSHAFPGWVGFGWGYQDWIIIYLLAQASTWYRKAFRLAGKNNDTNGKNQALLSQAKAEIAMHRWGMAENTLMKLLGDPQTQNNFYLRALVDLQTGQVWLAKNEIEKAKVALSRALDIFRKYQDYRSAAEAAHQLARTFLAQQDFSSAAEHFIEAYKYYQYLHDNLSMTQIAWELEALQERPSLPQPTQIKISSLLANQPERSYLIRFPDTLLRWFRRLVFLGSIPISYLLAVIGGSAIVISIAIIESFMSGATQILSLANKAGLVLVMFFSIPAVLWGYHLVYGIFGLIFVRLLGKRLVPIQKEQPDVITTNIDGIQLHTSRRYSDHLKPAEGIIEPIETTPEFAQGVTFQVLWKNVKTLVTANYKLWERPLPISSRSFLLHPGGAFILEGVTSGYEHLIHDVRKRLGGNVNEKKIDFVILANHWTYLTLIISLVISILMKISGRATWTICEPVRMDLYSPIILLVFMVFLLFLLPVIVMFRLIRHRYKVLRETGVSTQSIPIGLLWLAGFLLIFLTLIGVLFIFAGGSSANQCDFPGVPGLLLRFFV